MTEGGPQGSSYRAKLELKKMQILSRDMVASDAAAARVMGLAPENVRYITMAENLGLGTASLDSINIKRIAL